MIPTRIGQVLSGGTFTGFNRICNQVYAIVVAPKCTETVLKLKTSCSTTFGTQSTVDGLANTLAMNDNEHPAALYCKNLTVNGFSNWYLPSRNESELCYRYLKPTDEHNSIIQRNEYGGNLPESSGTNLSSVPLGHVYTKTSPAQTIVIQYMCNNREEFNDWNWTSTEYSADTTDSLVQFFSDGDQDWYGKFYTLKVRAVRRELIACLQEK